MLSSFAVSIKKCPLAEQYSEKSCIFAASDIKTVRIMCTYNVRIDDRVLERVRPHFDDTDAMQQWIERQLQKVLEEYAAQYESQKEQETRAQVLLQKLDALKDDPEAFYKMAGILGKPKKDFSWDELREEAYFEKYGI